MSGFALTLALAVIAITAVTTWDAWHHSHWQAAHAAQAIYWRLHGTPRPERTVWAPGPVAEPCQPKLVVQERRTPHHDDQGKGQDSGPCPALPNAA